MPEIEKQNEEVIENENSEEINEENNVEREEPGIQEDNLEEDGVEESEEVEDKEEGSEEDPQEDPDKEIEVIGLEDIEDKKVRIKNKKTGEEIVVDVKELKHSYFREDDYTKKTQRLAKEYKEAKQSKDKYLTGLNEMAQVFGNHYETMENAKTDLDVGIENLEKEMQLYNQRGVNNLSDTDFQIFGRKKAQLDQLKERAREIEAQREKTKSIYEKEQKVAKQKLLEDEMSQLERKVPQFKDPVEAEKLQGAAINYLRKHYGDEANSMEILDHREMMVILDAVKYDALKRNGNNKLKPVNKPSKGIRSDAASERTHSKNDDYSVKLKRARQTGKRSDIASLISEKL